MGRDIQIIPDYTTWVKFQGAIRTSMMRLKSRDKFPLSHLYQPGKLVAIRSGTQQSRSDYYLDRYACYLIAINGDTPETGIAQSYFVVQTRRQEVFDKLTAAKRGSNYAIG